MSQPPPVSWRLGLQSSRAGSPRARRLPFYTRTATTAATVYSRFLFLFGIPSSPDGAGTCLGFYIESCCHRRDPRSSAERSRRTGLNLAGSAGVRQGVGSSHGAAPPRSRGQRSHRGRDLERSRAQKRLLAHAERGDASRGSFAVLQHGGVPQNEAPGPGLAREPASAPAPNRGPGGSGSAPVESGRICRLSGSPELRGGNLRTKPRTQPPPIWCLSTLAKSAT
ncbi:hypothetical protein SKAU_G00345650 [Synaphobranchus kaupii]|uniref:Uncharacterized protein n=1 Tax=Synaphobranchus kaupii TaxID=118154 RepID=A0A9Q1IHG4_SYNKA|nr:hypothetical protein SKAU_G00345650 [Synaphobranchus kaupii]